jgi:NAD(P)-dependent dehydrogenase (short-subunit alcohol dehydrogenase family)
MAGASTEETSGPQITGRSFGELKGKVCVLTGGGGVIGTTLALGLAQAGIKVAVLDNNKEAADKAAQIVRTRTEGTAVGVLGDVLNRDALIEAKKQVNALFGTIDILINGAGGNHPAAVTKLEFLDRESAGDLSKGFFGLSLEGFKKVFDLNFLGTVLPTMVFAEDMVAGGGNILNISSMNSYRPLTKVPAYSAAKAGINNLTQWLAVHFAKLGIRVNAIAPGFFLTHQNTDMLIDKTSGRLTDRGEKIISHTPMGRFGETEELVGTALYLLSDLSRFVTGVVIPVDGGFSAYSGV